MSQLVLVVPLKVGKRARAREILDEGPPFDLEKTGFERHQVYLTEHEVVFVFEGTEVEWRLDDLVDDQYAWVFQATLEAWRPLIEGEPRIARAAYTWTQ